MSGAATELLALNRLCADSWCEGHNELFFHDLRCADDGSICHLGIRFYSAFDSDVVPDAGITPNVAFRGAVLGHTVAPRCLVPCTKETVFAPCNVVDVRCELPGPYDASMRAKDIDACIVAVEDRLRSDRGRGHSRSPNRVRRSVDGQATEVDAGR
jgi:hypothetical protein